MVTPLGAGTVVGQIIRWDGTNWVAALPHLELVAESVDPAAAASLAITGLVGDTDQIYLVIAKIMKDGTAGKMRIRFNSDAGSNYKWTCLGWDRTGQLAAGSDSYTYMPFTNNDGTSTDDIIANGVFTCQFILHAKSGTERHLEGVGAWLRATAILGGRHLIGDWTDTSTNLTEIDFIASAGNIGGTGTLIRVYKVLG